MDTEQITAIVQQALQQGTQALIDQIEKLQEQVQNLQEQTQHRSASSTDDDSQSEQIDENVPEVEEPEPENQLLVGHASVAGTGQKLGSEATQAHLLPHGSQQLLTMPSSLKMPKPEKFSGKSMDDNEIENWIFAVDNLFVVQGAALTDGQQLAYAVGYLVDDALSWWQTVRCSQDAPKSWSALKLAMLEYFVSPTKVSDAKDELLALTQRSAEGIHEYIAKFQRLLILAQITTESDKVYAFIRGLRRFTAGSVRMHKPNTLIEAMSLAAEFEGAFKGNKTPPGAKRLSEPHGYQRDGKRSKFSSARGSGQVGGKKSYGQSGKGKYRSGSSSGKPTVERYGKTPAEIEALRRQNACFACGQKGHSAKGCPSKN
jgi:hypothetical protein